MRTEQAQPGQVRRFELTAALTEGGSANAKAVFWDGADWTVLASGTFKVYDSVARNAGSIGDRGFCCFMPDSQRWEVVGRLCPS